MKKFLEFIWVLIEPVVVFLLMIIGFVSLLTWVFTGFGILIVLCPKEFPSYLWVKCFIIIFDIIVFTVVIVEQIRRAYEKVYKN